MQLQDFVKRFEALSDEAFASNFGHPFLLETGPVLATGPSQAERSVFLLRARRGRELVIGRGQSCDLRLKVEAVSSRHAALSPPAEEGQPWTLVDTESTNGTFVEGVRLQAGHPTQLLSSVAVRFGPDSRFTFLDSEAFLIALRRLAKEAPDPTSDERAAFGQTNANLEAQLLADSNVGSEHDESIPEILLHADDDSIDSMPVRLGDTLVVGRTPRNADFVLPHKNVSRKHAELNRRDKGVFIRDLGSSNGTFVGSTRVGPHWLEVLINKHVKIGPYTIHLSGPEETLGQTSVTNRVLKPIALEGSLEDHSVRDILSDVELGQLTGILKIDAGKLRGLISFRAGQPVDARLKDLKGDEALKALFGIEAGSYSLDPDALVSKDSRSVTRTFAEFALEAFFDET
ncbi:MAG: FHA domain-containing protein [Planctomycetes bacterium]|nr:FHA domain-containing protein [Planctomycetota bacterium]